MNSEHVDLSIEGSIAIIRLAPVGGKIAILNPTRIESLQVALKTIFENKKLRGLIITGAGASGFCAGADLSLINKVVDATEGEKLAEEGQDVFSYLSKLKLVKVAAISGACVGGGYELALACDYRVALDDLGTKIGLPETRLGILPGFGGSMRLPRLIGIRKALDIILNGKTVNAQRALHYGMVDEVVSSNELKDWEAREAALLTAAKNIISGAKVIQKRKITFLDCLLGENPIGRALISFFINKKIMRDTQGHYPAPLRAAYVAITGLSLSENDALKLEAKELGKLIISPESKALVHLFHATEASSKLGRAYLGAEVSKILVLGAGVMGVGICAAFLRKGFKVGLVESFETARLKAEDSVRKILQSERGASEEKIKEALSRLIISESLDSHQDADFVIEAIIEEVTAKRELLAKVTNLVSPKTVIATNTSSLSVTAIAEGILNPERFVGMHFFNPVSKMPLVEVIRGQKTSESAFLLAAKLSSVIGKYPVVVEDVPGFVVNRILSAYIAQAAFMVSEGVSIKSIDQAAKKFGFPMGPIRLLDEVGLDIALKVRESMVNAYGNRMFAPDVISPFVKLGRLGKKSKKGFYLFNGKKEMLSEDYKEILGIKTEKELNLESISKRLTAALVDEAKKCYEEGVAGKPGEDAATQIDLASVMGMGFPPFRGGVFYYLSRGGC